MVDGVGVVDGVGLVVVGSDVETAGPLPTVENTKRLYSIIYSSGSHIGTKSPIHSYVKCFSATCNRLHVQHTLLKFTNLIRRDLCKLELILPCRYH